MKKIIGFLIAGMMLLSSSVLFAKEKTPVKNVKIGVLVADTTGSEALAFRDYYERYIAKVYKGTKFIYSERLEDASAEKTALENMIAQGCKAVISFSSADRPAQIEICEAAKVYYAVATGVLNEKEYEKYKSYKYYVGSIGPSLKTEFDVGYALAKHYIDQGYTKYLVYGGGYSLFVDMHVERTRGMIQAFVDSDPDTSFEGELFGGTFDLKGFKSKKYQLDYMDGFPGMPDSFFTTMADKVSKNPEVLLAVGVGFDFFAATIGAKKIKLASVDAYTDSYREAFATKQLDFIAGKFASSIGPIFIATMNAIDGHPLRNEEGNAFTIDQGYWYAADAKQFNTYYNAANSLKDPAYNKAILDKYLVSNNPSLTYKEFEDFVSAYSYEDIISLKK